MPKAHHPSLQGVPVPGASRLPAGLTTLFFLGLLALPDVSAEGVIRDSIGPVSSGRGGTNLAYSDNLTTLYDNPAALASMEGLHFDLSVDFLKTELNFRNALNDADAKDDLFVLPSAWISWQAAKAPAPITVGIGFFMPAGFGAEFELQNAVFGRQEYSSKAGVYKILPAVAIDLGKGFSVGGGIGFAYEQAQFHTPYTFQSGAFAGVPGLVDIKADAFGYTWNLGVQYRPNEHWTFGAAYIEETRMNLEGDFSLDVTGVPLPPEVTAAGTTADYKVKMENTWPRSFGIGTSTAPTGAPWQWTFSGSTGRPPSMPSHSISPMGPIPCSTPLRVPSPATSSP